MNIQLWPPSTPIKILGVLVVLGGIVSVVAVSQGPRVVAAIQVLRDPEKAAQMETERLVAEVSKLIELPEGIPTIATVTDKEKLQNQTFFAHAENEDKVLIYLDSKKAYLYRPSTRRLIEVAPLTVQNDQTTSPGETAGVTTDTTTEADIINNQEFTVALYNGTTTSGLTTEFETEVLTAFPKASIALKETATKTDYAGSFIVDIQNDQPELVQAIATQLSLPVQSFPEGENPPAADILIILGQDEI